MPPYQALDMILLLYQPLILYVMQINGILHGVALATGLDSHQGISAIFCLSGMYSGGRVDSQRAVGAWIATLTISHTE